MNALRPFSNLAEHSDTDVNYISNELQLTMCLMWSLLNS